MRIPATDGWSLFAWVSAGCRLWMTPAAPAGQRCGELCGQKPAFTRKEPGVSSVSGAARGRMLLHSTQSTWPVSRAGQRRGGHADLQRWARPPQQIHKLPADPKLPLYVGDRDSSHHSQTDQTRPGCDREGESRCRGGNFQTPGTPKVNAWRADSCGQNPPAARTWGKFVTKAKVLKARCG